MTQPNLDAHLYPPCEHCGHAPGYHARETQQAPYRGMWQSLVQWEAENNPHGLESALRQELRHIADRCPDGRVAFAVNTTRFERPLDEVTPVLVGGGDG